MPPAKKKSATKKAAPRRAPASRAKKTNGEGEEAQEAFRWSDEIIGIIFIGLGLVLFCSLIRYTPGDLPVWVFFKDLALSEAPNNPRANLIGPIGTILGVILVQLLGAASYLLCFGLIWIGIAKLFLSAHFSWRPLIGLAIFVVSGACLLAVQEWFLMDWAKHKAASPGGLIGKIIGVEIFKTLLASAGSMIVLMTAYLISAIMLLGFEPIKFIKGCWKSILKQFTKKGQAEAAQAPAAAAALPARKTSPPKASTAAGPAATGAPAPEPEKEDSPQLDLPLVTNPTPQIIDSSQKKITGVGIGERPFERKARPQHATLSTEGFEDYQLPGFSLLDYDDDDDAEEVEDITPKLLAVQKTIIDTCQAFNVEVTAGDITRGPTITRYEIYPAPGLRVSRITQLEADIARATKAERINILAPIPGKDTVGIEIANDNRVAVPLRELLQDDKFRSSKNKIPLALGKDVYGNAVIGDLAAMPHCLVAGATGAGKSVCINSIIASILFKFGPDELRFIMVDPKVVEMQMYSKLPHLVVPVVTDPKKVVAALKWTVNEMERRYKIFAKEGVRNFDGFNDRPRPEQEEEVAPEPTPEPEEEVPIDEEHVESIAQAFEDGDLGPIAKNGRDDEEMDDEFELEIPDRFPYIVVIIDELADLMQTAPADVESCIARIAQKARAAGIHLIIATQTPRADVVTGIIKANIPSRIAFQVSSALDSRVILDTKGAEKLTGKGDMLFLPPGSAKLERSQGAFISDEECEAVIDFCSNQTEQKFEEDVQRSIESGGDDSGGDDDVSDADEEIVRKCIDVITTEGKASTSLLQRRLRLGYTKAARMMDIMEDRSIIGPGEGAKPREILIPHNQA